MLEKYKTKRDFSRTREPDSTPSEPARGSLRFVVQKHAARRMHYDFRLELDGVLKSWPVPKGPSLDPGEKRLAVMVEDHPLEYATFEGVIAHGNYGAGQVIVWDTGVYSPDEGGQLSFGDREEAQDRLRRELEDGKMSFTLRGRKLKGSWTLVRTTRGKNDWLLIKHKDGYADPDRDVLLEDRSVVSELTIDDLKAGRMPDPSKAMAPDDIPGLLREIEGLAKPAPFPSKTKPMLAGTADKSFSHTEWLFEPKLDGIRALAQVKDGQVILLSRNGIHLTDRYPMIVKELESQSGEDMLLDGEIVALNEQGLPDFGLIQRSIKAASMSHLDIAPPVVYYPFDLLHFGGFDLGRLPLHKRKDLLERVLSPGESLQPVQTVEAEGEVFFQAAKKLGLEGMIAKRRDSTYEPGLRSRSWLKVKVVRAQEFVIGGYSAGAGARAATFGALLVGYYDEDGALRYAGSVGSGFDNAMLDEMLGAMRPLEVDESPFSDDPGLGKIQVTWVRPQLVAQVKFAQWTDDSRLRAPVFTGLRSDVEPTSVRREAAESPVMLVSEPAAIEAPRDMKHESKEILEQVSTSREKLLLEVGVHRISLTNLNKVLWPEAGNHAAVTKHDMISYYVGMGPLIIPHLRDRPLTLTRYPNGIEGTSFYQKRWEDKLPEFVETVRLFSSHNEGDVEYIVVNNLPTLVWLAQLADIELHPWLSRISNGADAQSLPATFTGTKSTLEASVLNYPDFIVFDLDPYIYSGKEKAGDEPELNRRAFAKAGEVARTLKEILDQLSLSSFLKTSGKTGLHIYVPVLRQYNYTITRKTCELVGRFLMQQRPMDVTMEWSVSKRSGKIFLDHNQNVRGKNMASIYSLRPLPGAPVSTPLRWDELSDVYPPQFDIQSVPSRVEELGDLWAEIHDAKHDLRRLLETEESEVV